MKRPFLDDRIRMTHGGGGPAMRALIESVFLNGANPALLALGDGAALPFQDRWLILTTDAHVVKPIFFPGGDIGRLAISGVVNDLAVMGGCEVLGVTASFVIEEGFSIDSLRQIHTSMLQASEEAKAPVVTGDTKVMGRGELDGLVIMTSGVAIAERVVRDSGARVGDVILVTGTVGDHGLSVLSARHDLGLQGGLRSDVAPVNGMIRKALAVGGVNAMKDPTRGGLTSCLREIADRSGVQIVVRQDAIPMSDAARGAAEILGIDPLAVANEGKVVLSVLPESVAGVLEALRSDPLGRDAAVIGRVEAGTTGKVLLDTGFGLRTLVERDGEPLPRIC